MKVIKNLTPMLREMEAADREDSRPWYEKHWPYMRRGQRIKIISATGGKLEGREKLVKRIFAKLIAVVAPRVKYDLKQKLFVVREVTLEDDPYRYAVEKETQALVSTLIDDSGETIPAEQQHERVERGEYLLAIIEPFTGNWPRFSTKLLKNNLAHELLHIVDPFLGLYVKNGNLMENERVMKKATDELLRATKLESAQS